MNAPSPLTADSFRRRGLALAEALLVTVIWSSSFVIVKLGLDSLGPLTIAGLRYLIGSLVLLPLLLFRNPSSRPITGRLWMRLVLIGVSSYTVGNGALFWGLKYIPATTGSFLMGLIPLLVLIGGAILLREIPGIWQILGVLLSLLGSGLFFSSGLLPGELKGYLILGVGLLGFMSFSLLGRSIARDQQLDTLRLTTLPLLIGGLVSLALALILEGIPTFNRGSLLIIIWLAIINTALGYTIYNHALRELTALEMNMVMNLTPLFTALLGWILLGETISGIQLIGMLVMIVGVILVQWGGSRRTGGF